MHRKTLDQRGFWVCLSRDKQTLGEGFFARGGEGKLTNLPGESLFLQRKTNLGG